MRGALALLCLVTGCGGGASLVAWPPSLPLAVELEADEPRVLPAVVPTVDEVPAGPETAPLDGDIAEVAFAEYEGIRYLEIVFGEAGPDTPLPTIWVFHGRGDRARVPGGPFWELPRPVRIFVPQGPVPLGDNYGWFVHRVGDGRPAELGAALRERSDQLAAMIEAFTASRPTLGRPIVTGFSQGGHMTWAIALRHPELVDLALPSAGWIPPQLEPDLDDPGRFPRIRALHTEDDDRVPAEPTRALVTRLRAAGLDVEQVVEPAGGHAMTPPMDARLRGWLEEWLDRPAPAAPEEPGLTE